MPKEIKPKKTVDSSPAPSRRLARMGKRILLPAAMLAFVFTAGGSVVTVATTTPPKALLASPAPASLSVPGPEAALADFCDQHWGELDANGSYCRFAQWIHLNLRHNGADEVITQIPIVPGDTLRVESTAWPEAWVGGVRYDARAEKVVASSAGYLTFKAQSKQNRFAVERLSLERCFASQQGKIDVIPCPET